MSYDDFVRFNEVGNVKLDPMLIPLPHNIVREEYYFCGVKTTVCLLTTAEGFEVVGTSACVDPKDFDPMVGKYWAKKDAISKFDEIDGYRRHILKKQGDVE